MSALGAKARKAIPSGQFAEPGDRKFPLNDAAHIRSARSYERFATPAGKEKINAAAKRAGIGQKGMVKKP